MEVPSELFYDGKLVADGSIDRRSHVDYFPHIGSNNIFWHVVGEENQQKFQSVRGGRKSKYNMEEVKKVVSCLLFSEDVFVLRLGIFGESPKHVWFGRFSALTFQICLFISFRAQYYVVSFALSVCTHVSTFCVSRVETLDFEVFENI